MKTRYCAYCQKHKEAVGFITVAHAKSNTRRSQCGSCQSTRRRPRAELEKLAALERQVRKGSP